MLDATLLFIPNVKRQSHKQESEMLIEHTSRSTKDKPEKYVLVRYDGQLDAATNKVSIQSAN